MNRNQPLEKQGEVDMQEMTLSPWSVSSNAEEEVFSPVYQDSCRLLIEKKKGLLLLILGQSVHRCPHPTPFVTSIQLCFYSALDLIRKRKPYHVTFQVFCRPTPLSLEVFLYCMWKNEVLKMVLESGIIGGKKVLEFLKKQVHVRSYSVLIAYVIVVHLCLSFLLD